MLCVAGAILFAYRFWERPDWGRGRAVRRRVRPGHARPRRDPAHGAADRGPVDLRNAPADGAPPPRAARRRGDRGSRRGRALGDPQHARVRAPRAARDQPGHHAREHELREHLLRAAPRVVGPGVHVEPEPDARPVAAGTQAAAPRAELRRRPLVARPGGSRRARGGCGGCSGRSRPSTSCATRAASAPSASWGCSRCTRACRWASPARSSCAAGASRSRPSSRPCSSRHSPRCSRSGIRATRRGRHRARRAQRDRARCPARALDATASSRRPAPGDGPPATAGNGAGDGVVDAADDPFAAEGLH